MAALTLVVRRDSPATAAVLVVRCSCSFALATPVAVLASVGAAASKGLLIKGGRYLELLASADVLLIDKTGTLTLGRPQLTDVVALNGTGDNGRVAPAVARELGVAYRADLLPEDKMAVVREYQAREHWVATVGNGVNDAPALAQSDVGIAMGVLGSDTAIEAATPQGFERARRTMRVARSRASQQFAVSEGSGIGARTAWQPRVVYSPRGTGSSAGFQAAWTSGR